MSPKQARIKIRKDEYFERKKKALLQKQLKNYENAPFKTGYYINKKV